MRSLCLAVLFCLMFVTSAKADREGIFIRIECNQDFGLLDIDKQSIFGAKAGDFFYQDFLAYEYDINSKGKTNTKVMILNGYRLQESYQYHCELAPNQSFDITFEKEGAGRYINDVSFYVTVVEHQKNLETKETTSKKLLDKVLLGAGGPINKISLAATDYNKGTDINFFQSVLFSYIMDAEEEAPITQEIVRKHDIPEINVTDDVDIGR